eukprot:SAG11_NODE_27830_length_328_cov_1.117904_1_plen_71_part_01
MKNRWNTQRQARAKSRVGDWQVNDRVAPDIHLGHAYNVDAILMQGLMYAEPNVFGQGCRVYRAPSPHLHYD